VAWSAARKRGLHGRAPDDNRFLVNQLIDQPRVEPLTLVQNWASELER